MEGMPTIMISSGPDDQGDRLLQLLPRVGGNVTRDLRSEEEPAQAKRRVFVLDGRFASGGVWAGVRSLVEQAYFGLLEIGAQPIIDEHAYDLYMALPKLRDRIRPRYLCLTDTALGAERTRFYPTERAWRLVHGLVGAVLQYRRLTHDQGPWRIIVHNFDHAQDLATRFFVELARRGALHREIEVLVATQRDPSQPDPGLGGARLVPVEPCMSAVPLAAIDSLCPNEADLTAVERRIAEGSDAVLEAEYPPLLAYYRERSDSLAIARLAFKVLSVYNRRGYYHEAKSFIGSIVPCFDELVGKDETSRMNAVSEINSCLIATGEAARAGRLVTDLAAPFITKPHLLANMNYILAMHHLRYLQDKDLERAEHHLLAAVANIRAAEDNPESKEHVFLTAFINNGLAFLRVRQKRHQEALDLCRVGFESVTRVLGEHSHLLHRSVLQYNMAQVHTILDRLEEALACYEKAVAMDPFYAEYRAEIGNILQQLGRDQDAIDSYARAILYSSPWPEVWLSKAICHARMGQFPDALHCSKMSLELNPDQPELYAARAEIFTELGQPSAAVAEYDQAIEFADGAIAPRVNRAVLHFNSGSYEQALADMNEVIAREPSEAAHYENRAAIYQAIGRADLYRRDLDLAERCKETTIP